MNVRNLGPHYHQARNRASGFTLVEVLIVLVIAAVLSAIVVFAVQDVSHETAVASCQSDFKTVESATETFDAQMGAYPGGPYSVGVALTPASGTAPENDPGILDLLGTATTGTGMVGPWLKDYPEGSGHYQFKVSTDGKGTVSVSGSATASQRPPTSTPADCAAVS
jgi:prepilin-type N-terminal cleavage/methylation domain-containing protein